MNRHSFLFAALVLFSTASPAEVVFNGQCDVLSAPNASSKIVCKEKRGSPLKSLAKSSDGYYKIETSTCKGYAPAYCLRAIKDGAKIAPSGAVAAAKAPTPSLRGDTAPADRKITSTSEGSKFSLGVTGNFGLSFARPSTGAVGTKGTGYGGGILLAVALANKFRITAIPLLQRLTLNRTVDGTGALADPSPVTFSQTVVFAGASVMAGLGFFGDIDSFGRGETWWWDLGTEYLVPLSASQTDTLGNSTSFTTQDKLFFLVTGPSVQFGLSQTTNLNAYLQFLYNLGAQNGSQLLSGRLQLALELLL